jgi:hypothetical protein
MLDDPQVTILVSREVPVLMKAWYLPYRYLYLNHGGPQILWMS